MTGAPLHWSRTLITNERALREKLDGMKVDELKEMANEQCFIPKLKTCQQQATSTNPDADGYRQDKELERL